MALVTPKMLGGGVQGVAHVDGDERAEAADDEHAGGEGDDDEEQRGVVEDEVGAFLHVVEDARDAGWFAEGWSAAGRLLRGCIAWGG